MPKRINDGLTNAQRYYQTPKGRAYHLRRGAKHRAKKKDLPFDLSKEFVLNKISKGYCEVTGLPFDMVTSENYGDRNNAHPWTPTLDRIDPSNGYTEDNVLMVVAIYNFAKGHWKHEDVLRMAKSLIEQGK